MKAELECIPCFLKQALEAARMATIDGAKQREVLDEVAGDIVLKRGGGFDPSNR